LDKLIKTFFGLLLRTLLLLMGLVFLLSLLAAALLLMALWLLRALWARLTGQSVQPWAFQIIRRAQWERFSRAGRAGRADGSDVIDAQVIEVSSRQIDDGRAPDEKSAR
jgi:hypothetical protein